MCAERSNQMPCLYGASSASSQAAVGGLQLAERGRVRVGPGLLEAVRKAQPLVLPGVDDLADADVGVEQLRPLERSLHGHDGAPAVAREDQLVLIGAAGPPWTNSRIGLARSWPRTVSHWSMPPTRTL
jgi:hypothetical protein